MCRSIWEINLIHKCFYEWMTEMRLERERAGQLKAELNKPNHDGRVRLVISTILIGPCSDG